jgi:hypothetical protein
MVNGLLEDWIFKFSPPASNPAAAAAKAARFRRVRSVLEQQQLLRLYDAVFAQAHAPASS